MKNTASKKTGVYVSDEYGLFYAQPTVHPNPLRFYGKSCRRHRSLKGERRRLDGECIGCHDQLPAEEE
jgi:hypothetical protein